MKYIILVIFVAVILLGIIIPLENQLNDCRFEVNHLQAKLWRLQELSDVVEAMNQTLPSLALAQFKVIDKMIKDKRYRKFEATEQPLLTEKERKQLPFSCYP